MKKKLYILCFFVGMATIACTNDSEDDLVDDTPPPVSVNYTDDIAPIMQNNCVSCHSNPPVNGAPTPLVSYSDVVDGVEDGNLIDRISRQPGEGGFMPLGGTRLPQNLIDLIEQWEDEGFLEN
ncbi:hypothetical protein Q2T40_12610 [Winogradskyella maritima]|uniref:Cytochrome c domain-containing protein n=1 Tax=Winogradskyella maritima TaxID=1517766 RepID=A0ABV8AHE2_9FLAO|nr:hypothetical protein [Winogradskyella maritima]